MKYLDEYREKGPVDKLATAIRKETKRPWRIMEVCGGQTQSILKYGLEKLLPKEITLLHGPGCPVCVTPIAWIDKAIEIAKHPKVVFVTFGDMLRVPGTEVDLSQVRAEGADVRVVYSPLDALTLAEKFPEKEIVFFGIGFETTAPATALLLEQSRARGIQNLSLLVCHVLVPPALTALLTQPENRIDGFLAAGHVCTVMGYEEYFPLAKKFHRPIIVTGFEPTDILEGILLCVRQLESGNATVENQYHRVVRREGNQEAMALISRVFQPISRFWRGMGEIPESGLGFTEAFRHFDAEKRFGMVGTSREKQSPCVSGLVLQGLLKPTDCSAFGKICRPESPLGATMVSSEGACAAYYRYKGSPRD